MADEESGTPQEPAEQQETLHEALTRQFQESASSESEAPPVEDAEPEDGQEAEAAEEADEAETAEEADEDESGETVEDEPPLEAPKHWSKDDRALFASQSREAQEFLLRRHNEMQGDYTKKTQEVAELRKAVEPYRPMLESMGLTEPQAIQQLLNAQYVLNTQPRQAVEKLAEAYLGADWRKQFSGEVEDEDLEPTDPRVANLERTVKELESSLRSQQMAAQNEQVEAAKAAIEEFKAATDDAGQPKYPHFDALQERMGRLISAGVSSSLEEAYEAAVMADPELRKEHLESTVAQRLKKSEIKAKRSKVLPRSKSAGDARNSAPKTLRDELRAQFSEHS